MADAAEIEAKEAPHDGVRGDCTVTEPAPRCSGEESTSVTGPVKLTPPELGENYGQATDDDFGDCIHVLAPGEYEATLCGRGVADVAQACSMDTGYKPGPGDGCWTCLEASNRWARSGQRSA